MLILLFFNLASVNSKEVIDTKIILDCYANKKFALENFISNFSIEIKKIDWNKDSSSPPKWGSMTNIKIKNKGSTDEASLLLSRKNQVAFSYADNNDSEKSITSLNIFELDIDKLEMKKTSITIFDNKDNEGVPNFV